MPSAMTAPHPDAVGSYGGQAVEWIGREMGRKLRWFQELSLTRQLEHDSDGALVWRLVVSSTPRRVGKSIYLSCGCIWRVAHAHLFGEPQVVLFTGKDLPSCKDIHRSAWSWAKARGWTVRRGMGNEEIEAPDESRWIVRSQDGVFGYPAGLGACDESWKVPAPVITEGLIPAVLERKSPQVLLTSTAHTRATALMVRMIAEGMDSLDGSGSSLLLLWGAGRDMDPADPGVWRAASPHWDSQRESMIGQAWDRAARGVAVHDRDEPDPVAGFAAQYLNIWPELAAPPGPGEPLVSGEVWQACREAGLRAVGVLAAAVEDDFGRGGAVALAWRDSRGRVAVVSRPMPLRECWVQVRDVPRVVCGLSLRDSEGALSVSAVGVGSREAAAGLSVWRSLLESGGLAWDGPDRFADEGASIRVTRSSGNQLLLRPGQDATVWRAGLFAAMEVAAMPQEAFWVG